MSKLTHTHKVEHFLAEVALESGVKRLQIKAPRYLQHYLNTHTKVGDKISVTLTTQQPKRTIRQNRYYWAYLNHIAEQTGNDPQDLHTLFKGQFMSNGIVEVLGQKVRRIKSTTNLSVTAFSEYIDKIAKLTGIEALPVDNWELAPLRKDT